MLRLTYGAIALITVLGAACGGDSAGSGGIGGAGGIGGTPMLDPGPTCTAFCKNIVGECQVTGLFTEASCQQGCQEDLNKEYQHDEVCGESFEAYLQCVAELDCQGVYDWRDFNPPDDYPCQPAVSAFFALIDQGVCLPD